MGKPSTLHYDLGPVSKKIPRSKVEALGRLNDPPGQLVTEYLPCANLQAAPKHSPVARAPQRELDITWRDMLF